MPPMHTAAQVIVPHFAIDYPVWDSLSIKDGRLGYTNHSVLTWQVCAHR